MPGALQAGESPIDLARASLDHAVAMMQASGAPTAADDFEQILSQTPKIDWTPGS